MKNNIGLKIADINPMRSSINDINKIEINWLSDIVKYTFKFIF